MAYTPTVWANGDVITADKLNKLENGVANEQVGPAGPAGSAATVTVGSVATGEAGTPGTPGAAGASIKAIELYTNETGGVSGGKATLTDNSEITITVTTAPAG